jgi:formamidopyrimidine-DNA glycosylase
MSKKSTGGGSKPGRFHNSVIQNPPRRPLVGKPVRMFSHPGEPCGTCQSLIFRGMMFEHNGVYYCSRNCARAAAK